MNKSDDKRQLLKKILKGEIKPNMLNPRPWLFVAQTKLKGILIDEAFFAVKTCGFPTEKDRITALQAVDIAQALTKGHLFGLGFISAKDFEDASEMHLWRPFGNDVLVGVEWTGSEPTEVAPTPLNMGLLDFSDFTLGY